MLDRGEVFAMLTNMQGVDLDLLAKDGPDMPLAILQAALLRSMAKEFDSLDPLKSEDMRENANYFEKMAIKVQKQALQDNETVALAGLDTPIIFFRGSTIMDIAVSTESHVFMEQCCSQAITKALYGDMAA